MLASAAPPLYLLVWLWPPSLGSVPLRLAKQLKGVGWVGGWGTPRVAFFSTLDGPHKPQGRLHRAQPQVKLGGRCVSLGLFHLLLQTKEFFRVPCAYIQWQPPWSTRPGQV
jgi:hypothetical protein